MKTKFEIIRNKALDSNDPESLYDLAQAYDIINQFGNPNPFYNNFRRLYWYLKAGEYGYAEAYNNLAYIIEHELLVKQRLKRALFYYTKAAELGSELGESNMKILRNQLQNHIIK